MENIAVTKPDMGVLSQGRLPLSPFGALSQALAQEILARTGQEEGVYPYVPLDLLEEGEEEPQGSSVPARTAEIQVELKLVLEALRRAGKEEKERIETVQRVLERTVRIQERFSLPPQSTPRAAARLISGPVSQRSSQTAAKPVSSELVPRRSPQAAPRRADWTFPAPGERAPSAAEDRKQTARPALPAVEAGREAARPAPKTAETAHVPPMRTAASVSQRGAAGPAPEAKGAAAGPRREGQPELSRKGTARPAVLTAPAARPEAGGIAVTVRRDGDIHQNFYRSFYQTIHQHIRFSASLPGARAPFSAEAGPETAPAAGMPPRSVSPGGRSLGNVRAADRPERLPAAETALRPAAAERLSELAAPGALAQRTGSFTRQLRLLREEGRPFSAPVRGRPASAEAAGPGTGAAETAGAPVSPRLEDEAGIGQTEVRHIGSEGEQPPLQTRVRSGASEPESIQPGSGAASEASAAPQGSVEAVRYASEETVPPLRAEQVPSALAGETLPTAFPASGPLTVPQDEPLTLLPETPEAPSGGAVPARDETLRRAVQQAAGQVSQQLQRELTRQTENHTPELRAQGGRTAGGTHTYPEAAMEKPGPAPRASAGGTQTEAPAAEAPGRESKTETPAVRRESAGLKAVPAKGDTISPSAAGENRAAGPKAVSAERDTAASSAAGENRAAGPKAAPAKGDTVFPSIVEETRAEGPETVPGVPVRILTQSGGLSPEKETPPQAAVRLEHPLPEPSEGLSPAEQAATQAAALAGEELVLHTGPEDQAALPTVPESTAARPGSVRTTGSTAAGRPAAASEVPTGQKTTPTEQKTAPTRETSLARKVPLSEDRGPVPARQSSAPGAQGTEPVVPPAEGKEAQEVRTDGSLSAKAAPPEGKAALSPAARDIRTAAKIQPLPTEMPGGPEAFSGVLESAVPRFDIDSRSQAERTAGGVPPPVRDIIQTMPPLGEELVLRTGPEGTETAPAMEGNSPSASPSAFPSAGKRSGRKSGGAAPPSGTAPTAGEAAAGETHRGQRAARTAERPAQDQKTAPRPARGGILFSTARDIRTAVHKAAPAGRTASGRPPQTGGISPGQTPVTVRGTAPAGISPAWKGTDLALTEHSAGTMGSTSVASAAAGWSSQTGGISPGQMPITVGNAAPAGISPAWEGADLALTELSTETKSPIPGVQAAGRTSQTGGISPGQMPITVGNAAPAGISSAWGGAAPALTEIPSETKGSIPSMPAAASVRTETAAASAVRRTAAGPEPVELAYGRAAGPMTPPPPEPPGLKAGDRAEGRPAGKVPDWAQRFFAENSGDLSGEGAPRAAGAASGLGVARNIASQAAAGFSQPIQSIQPAQAGQAAAGASPAVGQAPAETVLTAPLLTGAETVGQIAAGRAAPGQPASAFRNPASLGADPQPGAPLGAAPAGTPLRSASSPGVPLQGGTFRGTPGMSPQVPLQTGRTIEWMAPGWQPPPAPTQLRERPQSARPAAEAPQTVRISDAEIRRTADQVYKILEDRIRRERRRLGL